MAVRTVPTSASTPPVTGPNYMNAISDAFGILFNVSALPLTSIGGTGNAITASLDPPLASGLANGMSFWLTPAANNTGAVTIAINGAAAQAIRDSAGNVPASGVLQTGVQCLITWNSAAGHFRILNSSQVTKVADYQAFTASGTWTKPAGTPANALVIVHCIGAGGGSGSGGRGGGGGAFLERIMRASDIGSSVTVTVGAGGASGTTGGTGGASSFGSHCVAYGGGGGSASTGGGGGGPKGPGLSTGPAGGPAGGATDGASGVGGGHGGASIAGGDGYFGGGGGGAGGQPGGSSVYGGGGGGNPGGASTFAGAGGSGAGNAPGGGAGSGAGARGEVRVWVIG